MRKLLAAATLLAVIGITGIGHADDPIVLEGTIELGTLGELGLTRDGAACDPEGADNGFDGVWFAVDGVDGYDAALEIGEAYNDADVYFFKADCSAIAYSDMAKNFIAMGAGPYADNAESGTVPADSAFVLVEGFFGLNMTFTLTLSPPLLGPPLPGTG